MEIPKRSHLNPDSKLICLAVHLLNERCDYITFLVVIAVIIILNDYFTSFYVKHFELPLCMKCAI